MTWSHRVWEQTSLRWCLKLVNWYMCVCQKSIGTSVGVVLSQVFPVTFCHHFTSFYISLPHSLEITTLSWNECLESYRGAAPLPQIRHKTRFSEQKKLAPKDARGKAESDMGSGYGHFWCGWVFRCYTTSLIWACKFVQQRIGLGNVKLIFRSYFRVYWQNQRLV